MFIPAEQRAGSDYRAFWAALNRAIYKRIAKGGRGVWIEASHNPVLDASGKPVKVVKFATDVTRSKLRGMTDAYPLDEIKGRHHSMFAPQAERDSAAYREFWAKLNRGEYQTERIGKDGREVWILASYNPMLDETGNPIGVVKFATDVSRGIEHVGARDFRHHDQVEGNSARRVERVAARTHRRSV